MYTAIVEINFHAQKLTAAYFALLYSKNSLYIFIYME